MIDAAMSRDHMSETLRRAAEITARPGEIRAAARLVAGDGTVLAEVAGALSRLPGYPASLLPDAPDSTGTPDSPEAAVGAAGATLYVTVDPFDLPATLRPGDSEAGGAGPGPGAVATAQRIADAGVSRVCLATPPAGLLTRGADGEDGAVGGATEGTTPLGEALARAGVAVEPGIRGSEALILNEAPIVGALRGAPFTHLFVVQTLDGRRLRSDAYPAAVIALRDAVHRRYDRVIGGNPVPQEAAGSGDLTELVARDDWDRLTVCTLPRVFGSGEETIGDIGVRELADVKRLEKAVWWTLDGVVAVSGYRAPEETFGPAAARLIREASPLVYLPGSTGDFPAPRTESLLSVLERRRNRSAHARSS